MATSQGPVSGAGHLDADRFARAVAARTSAGHDPATSLCAAGVDLLDLTGVGLMLGSRGRLDCVAASDAATGAIEAMEVLFGEGPCQDAYRTGFPCFDTDLDDDHPVSWSTFRAAALAAGVHAAFGFPVVVADACIGVLNCYRDRAGALSAAQISDAQVVASLTGETIVAWQADAKPDTLAWQLEGSSNYRVGVHQAAGRVSVQAAVSLSDAMALLRARAFTEDQTLDEIAVEVLANRLRFDP